jgi:hypothetical protein
MIANGQVVRENGTDPVYVMCNGTLVHIPTGDALEHLGYSWAQVEVVAAGSLAGVPTFDEPSMRATPASMVFAMSKYTSNITKFFPRPEVPGITLPNGNHLVALRGILTDWSSGINFADPDISMTLIPSAANLDAPGVDPSRFFRVGDILDSGRNPFWDGQAADEPDRHVWIATPQFHMELCGWPPTNVSQTPGAIPADWFQLQTPNENETWWPFDVNTIKNLQNQDVLVHGALITDEPHLRSGDKSWKYRQAAADWSGVDFVGEVVADNPGKEFLNTNPARWTEIHTFDSVVADPQPQAPEALIGVAVCARTSSIDPLPATATLDQKITCPIPAPGPNHSFSVQQYVLADTYQPSIVAGPTVDVNPDGTFHLHVAVQGAAFQGSAGRFAAVYRMSWHTGKAKDGKEGKEIVKEKEHGEKLVAKEKEGPVTASASEVSDRPTTSLGDGTARTFVRPDERPAVGPPTRPANNDPR